MKTILRATLLPLSGVALLWSGPALGGSHLWRFHEVFSNADGTVQFIEMKECCGFSAERGLTFKWVEAVNSERRYTFESDLSGNTARKFLLLATQGFAALPGAPAPDFIIPDGFLPLGGDTLEYWLYTCAAWTYGPLPTDGVTSMVVSVGNEECAKPADGATALNSPTNYAGQSGTVDASVPILPITWGKVKAGRVELSR